MKRGLRTDKTIQRLSLKIFKFFEVVKKDNQILNLEYQ